jgi:hypothetical protein
MKSVTGRTNCCTAFSFRIGRNLTVAALLIASTPLWLIGIAHAVRHSAPSARSSAVLVKPQKSSAVFGGQILPIYMSLSTFALIGGVDNAPVTIEVNEIPSGGGTIQIGCDHPEAVVSPSGSWPYLYTFAPGSSTTHTFSFATNSVSSGVTVQIYSAEDGVDLSNSANWRTCGTVMIGADM